MRAKVIQTFRDKETRQVYVTGAFFDGSEERIAEINKYKKGKIKGPFLEIVKEPAEPTPETPAEPTPETPAEPVRQGRVKLNV